MTEICRGEINEPCFSDKILRACLNNAISKLYKNDKKLIELNCSERAQVHWLAIYFEEELKDKGLILDKENGYCIDVEYNRFGLTPSTSKALDRICLNCAEQAICSKAEKKQIPGAITIDMVLHRRGGTDLKDNILCVEVKPSHINSTNCSVRCDQERVAKLCNGTYSHQHQPQYQYGAVLHLSTDNNNAGVWYHNGNSPESI